MKVLSFHAWLQLRWRIVIMMSALVLCILPGSRADYYAAQNGQTPVGPYTNWATAANHIQDAVNEAPAGSTVWVGAGRYTLPPNATNYMGSNVVYINRLLTLRSSNGAPETTIIDGQGANRGIAVYYAAHSYTYSMVIDGFTISNCVVTNYGGGILLESNNLIWTTMVYNCVLAENKAVTAQDGDYAMGGAIYNFNTSQKFGLIVSNCVIRANRVTNSADYVDTEGGAIWMRETGRKLFTHCLIESNIAGNKAGAIYSNHGTLEIENCIIRANRTEKYANSGSGGGAIMLNGLMTARNSLFCNNVAYGASRGGAISCQRQYYSGALKFYNCTIVNNRSSGGGGIYIRGWGAGQNYNPSLYIYNSIIQSNTVYNIEARPAPWLTNIFVNSCWYPTNGASAARMEIGNITSPVGFVSFDNQDFRLASDSPAVNAGTNQAWMTNAVDLDGGAKRIRYGTVDAGAYEMIKDATVYMFH